MSAVASRRFEALTILPEPAPASRHFEPIVIDLSKNRRRPSRVNAYLPWVLLMAVGFLILGLAGLVIYGEKTGFLKTSFLKPFTNAEVKPMPVLIPSSEISLPKIPHEMLDPKSVSVVPILQRLPVGRAMETPPRIKRGATPPTHKAGEQEFEAAFVPDPPPRAVVARSKPKEEIKISVMEDEAQARFNEMTETAANAAAAGRSENAIRLYTEALAIDPEDRDTAYNLAALLLQKASFFDTRGLWEDALNTYQQALHIWAADDEMGRSIRARIEWVQTKQSQTASIMEHPELPEPTASE
jgi:tetratricopeptide (TPR) repeat protein